MFLPTLFFAALIRCVNAQYVNLLAINWPIVAYALPSQPASKRNVATAYLVACQAGSIQTTRYQYQCDFVQPMTMVASPSTVAMNYTGLGGIGSITMSMVCALTSTTYAACTASGGVSVTSGPSTDVLIQGSAPATIILTGSTAASLFRSVLVVRDSTSLLTYTPPGATVIAVSTMTTDSSFPSSTTYYGSSGQITTQPTGTPSSSTGSSQRGGRWVWRNPGKALGAVIAAFIVLGVF